jgi:DNA-binding NarL/FixJ family response regulator
MIPPRELTVKQWAVALLVHAGHGNKQIAGLLGVTADNVTYHLQQIRRRLALDPTCDSHVLIARYVDACLAHHPSRR